MRLASGLCIIGYPLDEELKGYEVRFAWRPAANKFAISERSASKPASEVMGKTLEVIDGENHAYRVNLILAYGSCQLHQQGAMLRLFDLIFCVKIRESEIETMQNLSPCGFKVIPVIAPAKITRNDTYGRIAVNSTFVDISFDHREHLSMAVGGWPTFDFRARHFERGCPILASFARVGGDAACAT